MHSATYDKRIFTPGLLFRDLWFLISKAPALVRSMRNPDIGPVFTGKIMMVERLDAFYGDRTASDIMLLIRVISFGNLLGNTFDAFPARLKGQKAENSSALLELMFWVATFWLMLPAKWILQRRRSADTKLSSIGETQ